MRAYPLGQVFRAASPAATTTYAYDKAHRLASATDSRSGQSVAYRYSPGGLLNQMQVGARVTDYIYDPVGRLTGIWAPSNDLISYAYDRGGRLTEKWLPNGANTRYIYNADNTVQQIINRNRSGAIISQHDYTYDAGGNRLTHLERIAGTTTPYRYVYDELARLTEVRNNSTNALIEGYGYDPLGNRKTKTDGTTTLAYVYDAANQLKEIHQGSDTGALLASLDYDSNGNLTTKSEGATTTSLTYDALNRLIQAAKTGQPVQTYLYDAEGRRIKKTVGSNPTQYLYNGPDILAEYGASWSAATATYTHGPRMDDPILRATAGGTQYYHQDGLGSVVALSDGTGEITGTARYDAWGNPVAMTGAIPQYGYTGREPDETGLIYYRGRYYDPAIGRFTQPDPIGLQGGMNLYAYVNTNPVNYTDPWGLTPLNVDVNTTLTFNNSYFNASFDASGGLNSGRQTLPGGSGYIGASGPSQVVDLYVRAYAPWDSFGGGFQGDSRGPSTDLDATSRLQGRVTIDLTTGEVLGASAISSPSGCAGPPCSTINSLFGGNGIDPAIDVANPETSVEGSAGSYTVNFSAANPLIPFNVAPNLDLSVSLTIQNGEIHGSLAGDAFPNAEVFVAGPNGARMLHTFNTSGGPRTGPLRYLPGANKRPMGEF